MGNDHQCTLVAIVSTDTFIFADVVSAKPIGTFVTASVFLLWEAVECSEVADLSLNISVDFLEECMTLKMSVDDSESLTEAILVTANSGSSE